MTESSVRVGVRIRPLVAKERGQNVVLDSYDKDSIVFRGQTYTFDHVFGLELSQTDLYQHTAAPMLKNFLDGYNCTIMAYGQTGSGKTYTMGTSDITCQDIESQGLIPRFVNDLFENLNQPNEDLSAQQATYKIKVSFLEIYGEDVFDLLGPNSNASRADPNSRASLPVREDESGRVFVQGQFEVEVKNAVATLEALSAGTHNRITASTAMNAGSSRSHAVFTLHLEQSIRNGDNSEDVNTITSKLTFVDLAGSERIKRTGAEGQRLKEGIQINSGLFNLGQVINSLADEQKLKNGKNTFVPYRNSKLTHLLKDALGGNSQTLFLACISPAESNESESHSTLNYARQARNIKNKPVRNMDKNQQELRKLRLTAKAWMMKAVSLLFPTKQPSDGENGYSVSPFHSPARSTMKKILSPGSSTFEAYRTQTGSNSSIDEEALLRRPEVIEFINSFNASIQEKLDLPSPSPRKIRLSLGFAGYNPGGSVIRSPNFKGNTHQLTSVKRTLYAGHSNTHSTQDDIAFDEIPAFPVTAMKPSGRESILMTADMNNALEAANHLDETEQLVERMIHMVNKEKKLLAGVHPHHHSANNTAHSSPTQADELGTNIVDSGDEGHCSSSPIPFHGNSGSNSIDEEEILEVDRLIQEKEEILTKLMDNIKSYHTMKVEFEKLVDAINHLEKEKLELENELEKAKKTNTSSLQLEKMKERFHTIKDELKKMQQDKRTKESVYHLMQKESKQCEIMQSEIQKLKEAKISLLKQQKTTTLALQKLKKENQMKLQSFKKNEIKKQQLVNSLKSELTKKERIIGHKDRELNRVSMKLKACEDHITQLLRLQNRQRNKIVNPNASTTTNGNSLSGKGNNNTVTSAVNSTTTSSNGANNAQKSFFAFEKYRNQLENSDYDYYLTSKNLLEQVIMSQIERKMMLLQYQKKATELKELNKELLLETVELHTLQQQKQEIITEHQIAVEDTNNGKQPTENTALPTLVSEETHYEVENILQRIQLTENNIERISKEIDLYNSDLDDLSLRLEDSSALIKDVSTGATNSNLSTIDPTAVNSGNWQHIGNEVVSSFNLTQAQLFINELLNEKLSLVEAFKLFEISSQKTKNNLETLQEKYQDLLRFNKQMNQSYLSKMRNLEKQRISEIWTIIKSTSNDDSVGSSSSKENEQLKDSASDITNKITIQRTRDMEREIEALLNSEETLKNENSTKQSTITELEYQLQVLQNQLVTYQQLKSLSVSSSASSASPVKSSSSTESSSISAEFLKEIYYFWNEIGIPVTSQQEMIQSVVQSQSLMQQKLLLESKQDHSFKQEEIRKLISYFDVILTFTGMSFSQFLAKYDHSTGVIKKYRSFLQQSPQDFLKIKPQKESLTILLHYLSFYCFEFVQNIYPQYTAMKEQGQALVGEMMLNLEDLSQNYSIHLSDNFLQLMKWKSPISSSAWQTIQTTVAQMTSEAAMSQQLDDRTVEEKQKNIITDIMKIIQLFTNAQLLYCKEWKTLEQEIKQLNLLRIQMTNKIITLRDQIVKLTQDALSISSEEFSALGHSILQNNLMMASTTTTPGANQSSSSSSAVLDNVSLEKIYQISLQILSKKSFSNPPGSERIVVYLEKLQFLLESIKCNRINFAQSLIDLIQQWLDYYHLCDPISATASGSSPLPTTMTTTTSSSSTSALMHIITISMNDGETIINLPDFLTHATTGEKKEILYQKEFIQQLCFILQEIIEKKWKDLYQYQFDRLISFMKVFNNVSTTSSSSSAMVMMSHPDVITASSFTSIHSACKQLIQQYHSQRAASILVGEEHDKMIQQFTEFFDECSNMMVFMEESWMQTSLLSILAYWKQSMNHSSYYYAEVDTLTTSNENHHHPIRYSLREIMYQTSFLYSEGQRFQAIYETFIEMKKQDSNLVKHIQEFEEFEVQSNKDRARVLSGNSKLLIEEEKYRKTAKKRYEVISEKLVQVFQKLINLTTDAAPTTVTSTAAGEGSPNPATNNVPSSSVAEAANGAILVACKIDLNCFSQYTQNILKNGIQKERLELIRLHTSAAAMFSGAVPTAAASTTVVTSTTASTSTNQTTNNPTTKRVDKEATATTSRTISSKSSLYSKNKEKSGNTKSTTKGANNVKETSSKQEIVAKDTILPTPSVRKSSSRLSLSNHNAHRLSINSRLSISTVEPGLSSLITSSNAGGTNYAFQPPTPPTFTMEDAIADEENDQNNLNILAGITTVGSPALVGKKSAMIDLDVEGQMMEESL